MEPKLKIQRLQYDRSNLQHAYEATKRGMSVYKAARMYNVPESTLRDRTRGNVTLDAKPGLSTLFSQVEERELVNHIKYMADIGYGYNKSEIQYMARDYGISIGKAVKSSSTMSNSWFYDFLARWPELKIVMPQKLSIARAKAASEEHIKAYFKELGTILTVNHLSDHPESIFNIDETGVSTEHTPSKIVCSKESVAQCITSPRSSNVTIIAGGNAIGNHIPPYYVFPGKRWNNELLNGATPGSNGEMSKTGWSNSIVFTNYLQKHFVKYVKLSDVKDGQKTLILYDGHKSHILLTLAKWAKKNNVILFVLPPHSSHLTQPLDVGIFGPFKSMYRSECHVYMKQNPGMTISRYNLAELTARPYIKALRPENLVSAFRKAGIHPFNNKVVTPAQLAPSVIYTHDEETVEPDTGESSQVCTNDGESSQVCTNDPQSLSQATQQPESQLSQAKKFFKEKTITKPVPKRQPKRKFVPPFIAGNLLKKANMEILEESAAKKSANEKALKSKENASVPKPNIEGITKSKTSEGKKTKNKNTTVLKKTNKTEPAPSTSGLNKGGQPIELSPYFSLTESDSEISVDEDELCCVCHGWQPVELRGCQTVCFVTWGKCDFCEHWTHLKYCCKVTVLRRDSEFRCPHCPPQEE